MAVASKKPWACLLPNYCATKQYFQSITNPCGGGLVFGVPQVSYDFEHPEGRRATSPRRVASHPQAFLRSNMEIDVTDVVPSGTGHAASPFFSLWFFNLGKYAPAILKWFKDSGGGGGRFKLCSNIAELSQSKAVKIEKRGNPRQRKAARIKCRGMTG